MDKDISIVEILKTALEQYTPQEKRKVGVYFPSDITFCPRATYYSYLYQVPATIDDLKNFKIGIAFHELVEEALERYQANNPDVKVQNEIPNLEYKDSRGFVMRGRLDSLVEKSNIKGLVIGDKQYIVEFKSTSSFRKISQPFLEHILQLNFYLYFFPKAEGRIVYINKSRALDNIHFKEFKGFYFNQEQFDQLLNIAYSIHKALTQNNSLPPITSNAVLCNYCRWKDICRGGKNGKP